MRPLSRAFLLLPSNEFRSISIKLISVPHQLFRNQDALLPAKNPLYALCLFEFGLGRLGSASHHFFEVDRVGHFLVQIAGVEGKLGKLGVIDADPFLVNGLVLDELFLCGSKFLEEEAVAVVEVLNFLGLGAEPFDNVAAAEGEVVVVEEVGHNVLIALEELLANNVGLDEAVRLAVFLDDHLQLLLQQPPLLITRVQLVPDLLQLYLEVDLAVLQVR